MLVFDTSRSFSYQTKINFQCADTICVQLTMNLWREKCRQIFYRDFSQCTFTSKSRYLNHCTGWHIFYKLVRIIPGKIFPNIRLEGQCLELFKYVDCIFIRVRWKVGEKLCAKLCALNTLFKYKNDINIY